MAEGLVLREQRAFVRRELIYYLKISDTKTGRELGRMGDVHGQGMLVLGPPLPLSLTYDLSIETPKAMAKEGFRELRLRAQTMWSRPGPKLSSYYETGMSFIEPDEPTEKLINRLIYLFSMPGQHI
ncbi:MAG: PilZ domain-containing protein [Candidatus Adiutrix sp.]